MKELPNDITLTRLLQGEKPKVVYFGATWCGPCKKLKPNMEKMSQEMSDKFDFYHGDVDACETIAQELGISSIPLTCFIKDKKIMHKVIGGNIDDIRNLAKTM